MSVETPGIALRKKVRRERNMKTKIGTTKWRDKGTSYYFMYCENDVATNHQPETQLRGANSID